MTKLQIELIYRIASITGEAKKDYLAKIEDLNGNGWKEHYPICFATPNRESTFVHSNIVLKSADILFDKLKFQNHALFDSINWTAANEKYNGVTAYKIRNWWMIGKKTTRDDFGSLSNIYWSGIYLNLESSLFMFIKLEEYLSV